MRRSKAVLFGLCLVSLPVLADDNQVAAPSADARPDAPQTASASRLQDIPIILPDGDPKALVIYVSDRSGWKPSDDAVVQALRDDGDVVLSVDFSKYAAALDADDGECLYVVGEMTDLAQTAMRQLDIQSYMQPIVVGSGEGATFAYAAVADSPANTLGGAVASGFDNRLDLKLPFCPGASSQKTEDGKGFTYGFDSPLPNSAYLFTAPDRVDDVKAAASARNNITVDAVDSYDPAPQIVATVGDLADSARPFGDLPAIDLPSATPPKALAILVSGDGGWRDLDKTMGEWLSTKGVHVVGLDSLHYFWSKRTPQEMAGDLQSLIDDADPTHKLPVMLIGYSFGADTIPFAFPLMPKETQARTRVLALMAPGQTTSFQVTVSGWLGIDDSGYDIVTAIAALPADRVICVYGKEEDDSACPSPTLSTLTRIETDGGHHFDGNYPAIAQRFLDRLG